MSEFQLFCNYFAIILQYYLYKKCLKFKKFWIWSEGGGSEVFKKFWNSKSSELSEGGGVKPNWEFFPNFPVFFLVMAPLTFETKLYIAWIFTWFQVLYDHILMWWKISCWESCISYCQAQLQFQLCWAEIAFVSTFTCNIMNPNPNLNLTPTPTLVCMFTFTPTPTLI